MGRCKVCKRNPCGCPSSSSTESSSSLSTLNLHKRDQYQKVDDTLCTDMDDAMDRFNDTDKSRKVRGLQAYAIDTYNLKWRKRVLQVPSKEYPTLDDALASLQVGAGGYIIQLAQCGTYTMNGSLCNTVDDLVIEGDCDRFSGLTYSNRCRSEGFDERDNPPPVQPFPVCRSRFDPAIGEGPFELVVVGSDITVYGLSLRGERDCTRDPCFDGMCERPVVMFGANGIMTNAIATGRGNTISVNQPVPFTDLPEAPELPNQRSLYRRRCSGFGFFFPPRVTIEGRANTSMNALNSLRIIGCKLDLGPLFFAGGQNGSVAIANCWIANNVGLYGNFFFDNPNVWTGFCYCIAASRGTMNRQAFVGPFAHLTVDTAVVSVNYTLFASCIHAVECTNGGRLNMLGCELVNCCVALTAYQGALVAIPDCRFCCNLYTLYAAYMSMITSNPVNVPGQDTSRVYASPWFIHNVFIFIASMNSYIVIPNMRARRNLVPGILDGQVHTRLESIHVDLIGQNNSCFVFLPSASTPSPVGLGCVTASNLPGALSDSYLTNLFNANSWSAVTPSFILSVVGDSLNSITAAESLTKLAVDMSQNDVLGDEIPF